MHTIQNDALTVTILDPAADRERMGPRYCTGGYIFQVEDDEGPLLTGPTWPDSFNWFDGQGIPDSFALGPIWSASASGPRVLIPGIGICDPYARTVVEYCDWTYTRAPQAIRFVTGHEWDEYSFRIHRTVSLAGRVVRSWTRIENEGPAQLPIRWFPHPFYPVPDGPQLCSLPAPVTVPDGTTYSVGSDGYLRCSDLSAHTSVPVRCAEGGPLCVLQRHPRLGLVAARFSFAAGHVLVWGNERTFSFEPYLERTVGVGALLEWEAEYVF